MGALSQSTGSVLIDSAIGGATAITYTLVSADQGHTITFETTPVATVVPTAGTAVQSAATAAVAGAVPAAAGASAAAWKEVGVINMLFP